MQCKLLMIRDSGVGKTCLLLRYANDSFSPTFITTIGIDFKIKNVDIDDAQFDRLEGMVNSMTASEREDVKLLGKSRNRRIARGSGTQPNEVGRLVKQFEMVQKMTQQVSGMGMKGKLSAAREMAGAGGMPGMGGMPGLGGKGSTKTLGVKQGYKQRKKGKRR